MITLDETIKKISGLDQAAMKQAEQRWDSVAKPLKSLGLLEEALIRIAGITGSSRISLEKKAVTIFCGDNGVVEEGVTQTGQDVTAVVTENFSIGDSCVCIMAEQAGAWVFPVDMGVCRELSGYGEFVENNDRLVLIDSEAERMTDGREKEAADGQIRYPIWNQRQMAGTRNFTREPAMDYETAVRAVESGIRLAGHLKERGYQIIATGEMGIGNTTTSSAVISVLLGIEPELVTGRGAGLSSEGLSRKIQAIRKGIQKWNPDPADGIDVLAKVGGLDLAGLAGVFLGGAYYRIPVVIDGLISSAGALAAAAICPAAREYMLASHVSAEPAGGLVLKELGLTPIIHGNMCLGEGTGAVALLPLLDMAVAVYHKMSTFSEIQIEEYHPLE